MDVFIATIKHSLTCHTLQQRYAQCMRDSSTVGTVGCQYILHEMKHHRCGAGAPVVTPLHLRENMPTLAQDHSRTI